MQLWPHVVGRLDGFKFGALDIIFSATCDGNDEEIWSWIAVKPSKEHITLVFRLGKTL